MKAKHYVDMILEKDDEAKEQAMVDILMKAVKHLKYCDKEGYEDLEEELYVLCYGYTLSDELCEKWVHGMVNEDGSKGGHWTIEQTSQMAKQMGYTPLKVTEHEWWATMNMIYSDYYGVVSNDTTTFCRLAHRFLNDADAKEGKLYHYYMSIAK